MDIEERCMWRRKGIGDERSERGRQRWRDEYKNETQVNSVCVCVGEGESSEGETHSRR